MERDHIRRLGRHHHHRKWTQQEVNPIVDDTRSSNPHSLLPWLKHQLQTFVPANNSDYNPTLPTAS